MTRQSFTVKYRHSKQCKFVLGVTSIVPNLNGFLFFTEDGQNHFIESDEVHWNQDSMPFTLEYSTDAQIDYYIGCAGVLPNKNKVYDHRKK